MLGRAASPKPGTGPMPAPEDGRPVGSATMLTVVGDDAKTDGKFGVADSIHIECEVGGELNVGGQLVIGEKGVLNANVQTVDAIIQGVYEGNMVASGNVEITSTGRVTGNIETDSLVISKGALFKGNVIKKNGRDRDRAPVSLVEDKRAGVQK